MGEYSSLILTKKSAVFKGDGEDKTIELGEAEIDAISSSFIDFIIRGVDTSMWFGPAGGGRYRVVVVGKDGLEQYIPITVGLILDTKKAIQGKSTLKDDESIEIGTIKGSSRKLRLNVKGRRTQRNRRNTVSRKARKLSTRRR